MAKDWVGSDGFSRRSSAITAVAATVLAVAIAGLTIAGGITGLDTDLSIAACLALALLVAVLAAVFARSGRAVDHLTGGAAFSPVVGGLALSGLFSLAATVLLPGLIQQHGFDGLIPLVGIAGGLLFLLLLVGPALARSGAGTLVELAGRRFGAVARLAMLLLSLAATAGLLLGSLSAGTSLAARIFDVPLATAALAAAGAILLIVLPGGLRSVAAASTVTALLAGAALIGGAAVASFAVLGNPLPHLAYGGALRDIAGMELTLIESGLVDFGLFKPFLREFLNVDSLNWALLSLCLMGALAALPPLVQATGLFKASGQTRRGIAWGLTFVILALAAVPALAALARLETYRVVLSGSSFADLPAWVRRASAADAVRIHGASLGLVDDAERATTMGADSVDGLSAAMAARGARQELNWQRLDPSVQEAVLATAKAFAASPGLTDGERWSLFAQSVLPAAARAAGNESGKPDLAAISIDPQLLTLALPAAVGLPAALSGLAVAGVLGAALVLAAALVTTLSGLIVRDGLGGRAVTDRAHVVASSLATIVITVLSAGAVALVPVSPEVVLVASLTIAAAGLLPGLILAIWARRATTFGFLTAVLAGVALAAYYLVGTALYSVTFYETWSALSNSGTEAFLEFETAKEIWLAAEGDERAAAYADLVGRTSGGLWTPGLANWFGIAPAAAAALAVPLALLLGILVSLLTPRPSDGSLAEFDIMHGRRSKAAPAPDTSA
jgi:cation/acetate symporter